MNAALLEKNDGRKHRDGENQNQPLEIIAPEPTAKMQIQNNACDNVKGVKQHSVPLIGPPHPSFRTGIPRGL
jgi:hypothetical protein